MPQAFIFLQDVKKLITWIGNTTTWLFCLFLLDPMQQVMVIFISPNEIGYNTMILIDSVGPNAISQSFFILIRPEKGLCKS